MYRVPPEKCFACASDGSSQRHIRAFEPMERSDYLPSQILQELAKQVDQRVELDREAERVSAASHAMLPWHQMRKAHASRLANIR
jgi:hypothetical protein